MLEIIPLRTEADADQERPQVAEYLGWLRERYPEDLWVISAYWDKQDIPTQLRNHLTPFARPRPNAFWRG